MYRKTTNRLWRFVFWFTLAAFWIPIAATAEDGKNLAVMYEIKGDIQKPFNAMVLEKYPDIGFHITDPHQRVNDQYEAKYGSTTLDVLSFMSIVNDEKVMPLLAQDERLGGFSPFNMLIYKKLDDHSTHIGHILPEAMLDIVGIDDPEIRKPFIEMFKPLDEMVEKEFPEASKTYVPIQKMSDDRMIKFEYEFDRPDDLDEFIEEFQNKFEMSFINKGYLIAGFHDFMEADDADEALEDYDIFWTYSLCHLEFSYNVFDNEGGRPDAGLFAPCSMYVYIKADSNKMVIGMPRLKNWAETLGISGEKRLELVHRLDKEIPQILAAFGMKSLTGDVEKIAEEPVAAVQAEAPKTPEIAQVETPQAETQTVEVSKAEERQNDTNRSDTIEIIIPTPPAVPTPPKVKTINSNDNEDILDRSIKFSKRVPPGYTGPMYGREETAPAVNASANVGEVNAGRIAAYLRGTLIEPAEAEKRLKAAGFEVIAAVPLDKKSELISIVFTNPELVDMASKANRGFAASLRLLINKKENEISITNPLYMLKAFLQDDFDEARAKQLLVSLRDGFEGLKDSEDMLKYQALPSYHFMSGLPHYEDMVVVAKGAGLADQIKGNEKVQFSQSLANGSVLVGVSLEKRTNKFTQRIGTNNAAMLPYPILIENGEAKIMEPRYYISVMYPMLQMSQFMTIATVPGAMIQDCQKVFK